MTSSGPMIIDFSKSKDIRYRGKEYAENSIDNDVR